MNVNVKISITDAWRNLLAGYIDGKQTKRLATRKDINEFCKGAIAKACEELPEDEDYPQVWALSADEQSVVERLREEGHSDSYIRGWLTVGRRLAS